MEIRGQTTQEKIPLHRKKSGKKKDEGPFFPRRIISGTTPHKRPKKLHGRSRGKSWDRNDLRAPTNSIQIGKREKGGKRLHWTPHGERGERAGQTRDK